MNEEYDEMQQQYQETEGVEYQQSVPYYLQNNNITLDDFKKHAGGPLLSLAVHIVILILAATIVVTEPPQKEAEEIQVEMTEVKPVPPPPPPPPEPVQEITEVINPTDVPFERPTITTEAVSLTTSVDNVTTGSEMSDVPAPAISLTATPSNSALKMPGLMRQRTAGGIKSSLKMYGGTRQGEEAVLRALRWLKKVQNEDGSWGPPRPNHPVSVAITSVATLSFLAHGETPQSEEFGDTVLRALKKISAWASETKPPRASYGTGYSHAMLAYAVAEGYAMTKIPMLERSMNTIINTIVQGQNHMGSYDYFFAKTVAKIDPKTGQLVGTGKLGDARCDLSLAGWCYQAMKAAYAAGCEVDGLSKAMERGIKCIRTTNFAEKDGGFTYVNSVNGRGADISMTSVGTLCLQLMGEGKCKEARAGMKYLENYMFELNDERSKLTMNWKHYERAGRLMALYNWYYMTQAIFQGHSGDGRVWDKWNKSFRTTLTKEQSREGYWDAPVVKYERDPNKLKNNYEGNENMGGFGQAGKEYAELSQRVWSTSMCTLMLEVYYRFLPTFKTTAADNAHGGGASSSEEEEDDDDISL